SSGHRRRLRRQRCHVRFPGSAAPVTLSARLESGPRAHRPWGLCFLYDASMKQHARALILALAALALGASITGLYVHYQMLANPDYTSFCDISSTVSCEAVLSSRFATMFGIPVAAGGAIWSALVLLLA